MCGCALRDSDLATQQITAPRHAGYTGRGELLEGLPQVANRTLTPVTAKTLSPTPLVLFCWTQAFFAILLVLHLRQHVLSLYKVRETLGDTSEADAADSIALMLDWDPRL